MIRTKTITANSDNCSRVYLITAWRDHFGLLIALFTSYPGIRRYLMIPVIFVCYPHYFCHSGCDPEIVFILASRFHGNDEKADISYAVFNSYKLLFIYLVCFFLSLEKLFNSQPIIIPAEKRMKYRRAREISNDHRRNFISTTEAFWITKIRTVPVSNKVKINL